MAHFLRDERLTNLTIDEEAIVQLSHAFEARAATMPEAAQPPDAEGAHMFLTYIIRFDNKGYRVFLLQDLLSYFRQASYVERVIFTLESKASLSSNRTIGSYMELRLDEKEPNMCVLAATSDSGDWVDSSFSAAKEILLKRRNWNAWARSAWTDLLIQIAGVFVGFVLSLWAATKIAPNLTIDNSFLISFILVLLIFSNLWTYVNLRLHAFVNVIFPNLKFYRSSRDQTHWLLQAVIGGIVGAIVLYVLARLFTYIGHVLGRFVGNGA